MEAVKTLGHKPFKAKGSGLCGQASSDNMMHELLKLLATYIVDQDRLVASLWGHYTGVVVPL